jgi:hypothetical protein
LGKVEKRMRADPAPLTVILRDAVAGLTPGRISRTNSAGLPVLEIVLDPDGGPPELPPPPYKLVRGTDPIDLA